MEDFISSEKIADLIQTGAEMVMNYAPKVLLALFTLIIGMWLINRFIHALDAKLSAKDPTLNKFLCGLTNVILKILLLISVASMVGIATTSFIAVLGAAGLAIGLALQGSLSNFAGGVLILIFKHFKVGDTIEAQGYLGAVAEIHILYTVVNTFDNRRVIIPNGDLANSSLVNVSIYDKRRCDMTFAIPYNSDIDNARAIFQRLIGEDERSMQDPAPRIGVGSLGDHSINMMVRVWVATDDLWPYYWDMHEKARKTLDTEGVTHPFPHRDIHLYETKH